jgi:hypothetical protein
LISLTSENPLQECFSGNLWSEQKVPPQYLHLKGSATSSPQISQVAIFPLSQIAVFFARVYHLW